MKSVRFVLKYLRKTKKKFLLSILYAFFVAVFTLLLPHITQMFVDSLLVNSQTNLQKISPFWYWLASIFGDVSLTTLIITLCVAFVVIVVLKNFFQFQRTQISYIAADKSASAMRSDCFRKLAHLNTFAAKSETYLYFTNDALDFFRMVYKTLPQIFMAVITLVFTLVALLLFNLNLALLIFLCSLIMGFIVFILTKDVGKNFLKVREQKSKLQECQEEAVSQIRDIKIFNRLDYATASFERTNEKLADTTKKAFHKLNKVTLIVESFRAITYAAAIAICAVQCFSGHITVGYFVMLVSFSLIAVNALLSFANGCLGLSEHLARLEKVRKFLASPNDFKMGKEKITDESPLLEIKNINVSFENKQLFKNYSLNIEFGEHREVVMPQGAGKSALAKLLLKFFEVDSGDIVLGGVNYKNAEVYSLREQFSYVSQEPYIFEASLLQNITMFEDFDEEKMNSAIRVCQLEKIVEKFGLDYVLTENGGEISSQDKQKINLARAVYRNAKILLIDSAFNKFTPSKASTLKKRLLDFYKDRTVIILENEKEEENSNQPLENAK